MDKINKHKYFDLLISVILIILTCTFPVYSAQDKQINLNSKKIKQGDIIIVKINNNLSTNQINFNNQTYKVKNNKDYKIAIIPISYWIQPGEYKLSIKTTDNKFIEKSIEIISGDFDLSYIEVKKNKEKLVRPENDKTIQRKKQDQILINKARKNSPDTKSWTSNFIWPVDGQISTDFGATRYVNGKLQSKHSGIDIAAPKGKKVIASNTGTVKLAKNLLVTGNTIIIDHGWNVYTSYSHLSKITVKKDQKVNKGQKIGEIGSTGFSTGPHLHWTVTIGKVFINPKVITEINF